MFTGTELMDKTLGIIGFGRVGRLVSQRALAFGMNVIAFDPFVSEEIASELNVTLVDLDDLLAESDYITLHTALLEETEEMINSKTIAQMKDGVVIINAARGKLINEHDLAAALKSGKVGASRDRCLSPGAAAADHPLIRLAQCTAHAPSGRQHGRSPAGRGHANRRPGAGCFTRYGLPQHAQYAVSVLAEAALRKYSRL